MKNSSYSYNALTLLITLCFLVCAQAGIAQFNVATPIAGTGQYAPTDTVYISINGNDLNNGSVQDPVATFARALALLPFGTPGINGGNAYGLIRFLPGEYVIPDGCTQYDFQWRQNGTFKNVSVEGIGDVTIRGERNNFASTHLIFLLGDHIFIRNLKLRYGNQMGILLGRGFQDTRQNNVLIEDVAVDSVKLFGMLAVSVDTILIRYSKSLYSSRPGSEDLAPPCSWPSGLKFFACTHATIHDSEVAYSRGEGLNFQNTQYGLAYNNLLHDNPLNLYNDNSAHLIVRDNYIYNTQGINTRYWSTCPADPDRKSAGAGIMLANEGSCLNNIGGTYSFCTLNCSFGFNYPLITDVHIYNNIFHNTGSALRFWEGRIGNFTGISCISDVYFHNNSIVNIQWSDSSLNSGAVIFAFGSYSPFGPSYGTAANIRIENNIWSIPPSGVYPNMRPLILGTNGVVSNQLDVVFNNNLWSRAPTPMSAGDLLRPGMPYDFPLFLPDAEAIRPCVNDPVFVYGAPSPAPYITEDYSGMIREMPNSNVGAMEEDPACQPTAITESNSMDDYGIIGPNPAREYLFLKGVQIDGMALEVYDVKGRLLWKGEGAAGIDISTLAKGFYFLRMISPHGEATEKFIKQ